MLERPWNAARQDAHLWLQQSLSRFVTCKNLDTIIHMLPCVVCDSTHVGSGSTC